MGEVRLFAGNYAPHGWELCNGQLLNISTNTALFSLLGTSFGGDGVTTFGLPDYRGRMNIHPGQVYGNQGTDYSVGQKGGFETVTVTTSQYPAHTHQVMAHAAAEATADSPQNAYPGTVPANGANIYKNGATNVALNAAAVTNSNGGGQSHVNMQPTVAMSYIIATVGTYPSWS
ncbi:Microcystin dependent protein [Caenispirillum salinarum AK4]|uniref:Microcystin dependent protein n=1 Tax=Caenispirillum salinarum AK4 TaxID=1238182 RepID=K9HKR4_9PROT|nr:Microcystin dependent protein [Caenispirillum salinarum AK4]